MKLLAKIVCLVTLVASSAVAEDSEQVSGEARSASGGEHGRNHVAAILGYAQKSGSKDGPTGGKDAFVYGIEYQYRFHDRFSLGLFYEQSSGNFDAESFGIPASIFVTERFKVLLAIGSERKLFDERDEVFLRAGLSYDFEFDGIAVSPSAWIDFVNEKKIYFLGLTVGMGF